MSVLTIIESWEGNFKKTSFETLTYAKRVANSLNQKVIAITLNNSKPSLLSEYGADKIINISNASFENTSNDSLALICEDLVEKYSANTIIISNTNSGKSMAPLLAEKINAGLISNAIEYPKNYESLTVKCKAFSSKAFLEYESNYKKNIISILPNSIGEQIKEPATGEIINMEINTSKNLKIIERNKSSEKISISDAEIVVSAGRGLKGPENWHLIEELANVLNAGTACSKPVSDMGWRPHSEHVGQTGIAINPELYIAIGISGAIQHLAGVNGSKNIVVINTDAEAPFFKAANYGIIGDAFEVLPKLIEAIKKHKN